MWQRFTERARKAVFYAQEEAQKFGRGFVGPEHLVLGLCREKDSMAGRVMTLLWIDASRLKASLIERMPSADNRPSQDMTLTPLGKKMVERANREAQNIGKNYIGTEHLLLGAIAMDEGVTAQVFFSLGITLEAARKQVMAIQDAEPLHRRPSGAPLAALRSLPNMNATVGNLMSAFDAMTLRTGRIPELLFLMCIEDGEGRVATVLDALADPTTVRRAIEGTLISSPIQPVSDVSFEQIVSFAAKTAAESGAKAPHSGHIAFAAIKASDNLAGALVTVLDLEAFQTALLVDVED